MTTRSFVAPLAALGLLTVSLLVASPSATAEPSTPAPSVGQQNLPESQLPPEAIAALGRGGIYSGVDKNPVQGGMTVVGDRKGFAILQADKQTFNGMPSSDDGAAIVISTGDASIVNDPERGKQEAVVDGDQIGTDLEGAGGVDGNDLTQVKVSLGFNKDEAAKHGDNACWVFDFVLLTEEYPNYKGQVYNDTFTAEAGFANQIPATGRILLENGSVVAPLNVASGEAGELVSINPFRGFIDDPDGTTLNAKSTVLTAGIEYATANVLYLTVQDLGDSDLDTAVVVDNLRIDACPDISADLKDTDGDNLPDRWETEGVDYDRDGTPELPLHLMGADPFRKDLFVEVDWMKTTEKTCFGTGKQLPNGGKVEFCVPDRLKPNRKAIEAVIDAFATAPVENPVRPDGTRSAGIALHVDAGKDYPMSSDGKVMWGEYSRANELPFLPRLLDEPRPNDWDWSRVDPIMEAHFDASRRDVFHYAIYGQSYQDRPCTDNRKDQAGGTGTCGSSGISRGIGSNVFLMTPDWGSFSRSQEAGTFMHEFGHNLGLTHSRSDVDETTALINEIENVYQKGFRSIMSYCYQMVGLGEKGTGDTIDTLNFNTPDNGKGTWPCARSEKKATYNLEKLPTPAKEYDPAAVNEWNEITWDRRAGIGGVAGVGSPGPASTTYDALTKDEAVEAGVFAVDGDGAVTIAGPDLFAAGVAGQGLLVDVYNPSAVESSYRVEASAPFGGDPIEVTVGPDETQRVEVPLTFSRVTNGRVPVTVLLFNGDALRDDHTADVQAFDLTNDAVAAEVDAVLDLVADESDVDAEVVTALRADLEPVLAGEIVPDESAVEADLDELSDEQDIPLAAVGAFLAGLLAIALVGALALRRR